MKKALKRLLRPGRRPRDYTLRNEGDAARDSQNWLLAAEFYAQYLAAYPHDFGIWVQRGHVLKEAGNFAEADTTYALAARLKDNDSDLLLSRGHLAKLRGDANGALGFYHLSYAVDKNDRALRELQLVTPHLALAKREVSEHAQFDPRFYWELYLSDRPYNPILAADHYNNQKASIASEVGDTPPDSEVHGSASSLLDKHDMPSGRWLELFSAREFCLLSFSLTGEVLNYAKALNCFLEKGINNLSPVSFSQRFDVDFYKELHPHMRPKLPSEVYRSWLTVGLSRGEVATPESWLKSKGLDLFEYPRGFAWERYKPGDGFRSPNKWIALEHLLENRENILLWPLNADHAEEFLQAAGIMYKGRGDIDRAIDCYGRISHFAGPSPKTLLLRADAHHGRNDWHRAAELYDAYHDQGCMTLWSICLGAECHGKLKDHRRAIDILESGKIRFEGEQPWINRVDAEINAFFQETSDQAHALYESGKRPEGDALMNAAVSSVIESIRRLRSLPVEGAVKTDRVVILANQHLRQCTHYRVEQKLSLFKDINRDVEIFDWSQAKEFIAALPGASAAIFYRLPALPEVIEAILSAKSQGVTTYYEIDDLIFDEKHYPDPLESFEGQITQTTYAGLMFGVPLYKRAMMLCDYGISSTNPLSAQVSKVVKKGVCFVVMNGLDERNIGIEQEYSSELNKDGKVRIFYGSATLAHNQDFTDYAVPGLVSVLEKYPNVELVIVGHLKLSSQLDRFLDRITRVGLITDTRAYWSLISRCHINLAVVAPGLVGDCKSEIKWLEAAVLGVPSIVSGTATYKGLIDQNIDGVIAETPQEWADALDRLVASDDLRRTIGQRARSKALAEYNVAKGGLALEAALAPAATLPDSTDRKPRILIVNVFFPPQSIGGATRVVSDNIDDYLELGASAQYNFGIAAIDHDAQPDYRERVDSYSGLPVFRIAAPREPDLDWKPADDRMGEWFATVLKRFQPDLVHFHCVQRMTVSVMDACRELGVPYIISVHDGWWLSDYQFLFDERGDVREPGDEIYKGPRPGGSLSGTLGRLARLREALDGADRILAVSQPFADMYKAAGFGKAEVVENGLPPIATLPRSISLSGRVRIGHIGNTAPHKGFDLVEAAVKQGRFQNLELLALDHGRAEGDATHDIWGATPVKISGRVSQSRVAELYAGLDVLLAPSVWPESYGLVTREAHAAGVWVVASDRGAISKDVRENIDGFVIDVSTPKALQDVLEYINATPERFLRPPPRKPDQRTARDQAREILNIYAKQLGGCPRNHPRGRADSLSPRRLLTPV